MTIVEAPGAVEAAPLLRRLVPLLPAWSCGFESRLGGHPIQGFRGVSDMVALFTALAVGMLVAAAAVRVR